VPFVPQKMHSEVDQGLIQQRPLVYEVVGAGSGYLGGDLEVDDIQTMNKVEMDLLVDLGVAFGFPEASDQFIGFLERSLGGPRGSGSPPGR